MLIISLVLITERSALRGMQKGGKKVYESARSGNERHKERVRIQREEREQRREEQALRRMDRKVEGVANVSYTHLETDTVRRSSARQSHRR